MIHCVAIVPHPIYIRTHGQLRVTQSSKTQNLYSLSSNHNFYFPNPNFLSPFVLAAHGGGSSWSANARSTQGASSPMGSIPRGSSLVQAAEAVHTGLTGCDYQSDRLEIQRLEISIHGLVHV
jgi:hypothetical protein